MLDINQVKIVYEDNHLIGVNKPGGWLVHGDQTGDTPLSDYVKTYIKMRYNKPGAVYLGVIHRLDRPVSGTVVFAKTSKALERMNRLFQDRKVEKEYLAVTAERPNPISGTLEHYLLKNHEKNKTSAYEKRGKRTQKAKQSVLKYELLAEIGDLHLLKVNPITGRPHQIRVQLSQIGCPIRGDLKYGYPKANQDACIHLHCRSLSFVHPVKKEPIVIQTDLPEEQIWNQFGEIFV